MYTTTDNTYIGMQYSASMEPIYAILRQTALRDGRVSEDEARMLDTVLSELDSYHDLLRIAKLDGIITDEEKQELEEWRERIWDRAVEIVMEDNIINQEEHDLLMSLVEVLKILEERE